MRNNYKIRLEGIYELVSNTNIRDMDTTNKYILFPFDITVGNETSFLFLSSKFEIIDNFISMGLIKMITFEIEQVTLYVDDTQYTLERIL